MMSEIEEVIPEVEDAPEVTAEPSLQDKLEAAFPNGDVVITPPAAGPDVATNKHLIGNFDVHVRWGSFAVGTTISEHADAAEIDAAIERLKLDRERLANG